MLQPLRFAAFHASVLRLPAVIRLLGDAVLPAQLCRRQPGLSLFQNRDDLFFAMPLAFQFELLSEPKDSHCMRYSFRGLDQSPRFYSLPFLSGTKITSASAQTPDTEWGYAPEG